MNRRPACLLAAAALLATAGVLASPDLAAADGAGCRTRVATAKGNVVDGWYNQVSVTQVTRWTNCSTHTHPEEVSIRFSFTSDDDARDWRNDSDDYIRYSCKVMDDDRTVQSFGGRLNYEDRADGFNSSGVRMSYAKHPRTVCTGEVVIDYDPNWTFRSSARAV